MGEKDDRRLDVMDQVITWAFDHVEVEALFDGAELLLVGDAHVLAVAVGNGLPPLTAATGWLEIEEDRALMLRGPGRGEGPWVYVFRSDDGPLVSLDISPDMEMPEGDSMVVGSIDVPSGRLVVGTPTSIAWWGAAIEPSGSRQVEMLQAWDSPGVMRDCCAIVIRLVEPGPCMVEVIPGTSPMMVSFMSVTLPTPSWLPESKAIVDPTDPR